MSSHSGGKRELLVDKFIIVHINIKAIEMLNKSGLVETYACGGSGGTHWDEAVCNVNLWNPLQTLVKLVLMCCVDRT